MCDLDLVVKCVSHYQIARLDRSVIIKFASQDPNQICSNHDVTCRNTDIIGKSPPPPETYRGGGGG